MNVHLVVPEKIWGRLATLADERDVSVADIALEALRTAVEGRTIPPATHRPPPIKYGPQKRLYKGFPTGWSDLHCRAIDAVLNGHDDGAISVALDVNRNTVAKWRRDSGIQANGKGRGIGEI